MSMYLQFETMKCLQEKALPDKHFVIMTKGIQGTKYWLTA